MKHIVMILGLMGCLAAAEPPTPVTKPPAGLPAGAQQVDERTWRHKDNAGKSWLYYRTPFGWSRGEEKIEEARLKEAQEKVAAPAFRITSVKGEVVAFERDSPFGKSKWTKKKSDLGADERLALEQFESAAPAAKK
jgi:hypothetical protein